MHNFPGNLTMRCVWATLCIALQTFVITAAFAQTPPAVTLRPVIGGLSLPVEMTIAPDGSGRMFVVEQAGRIKIIDGFNSATPTLRATPFLDISGAGIISSGGERGLLGLAFHPQYVSLGLFYVFYARAGDGALVVARVSRSANDANLANAASLTPVLEILHPVNANHNGGKIAFDPDGYLVISTGDGGGGGDPDRNSLDRRKLLGKLLRISVGAAAGYTIPPGNPYAGNTCANGFCPEIWHYGLRNTWKFSFDRSNGDLYIADVGQGNVEEVNYLARGAAAGANFGWGVFEGNDCYNDNYFGSAGACASLQNHTRPVATYGHNSTGGFSITGGYVYTGARSAALGGYYIYADYVSKRMFAAKRNASGVWNSYILKEPDPQLASISTFGEDDRGELYIADYSNGKILAIDGPTGPGGRCPV